MKTTILDHINTLPEGWDPYWATSSEETLPPQIMNIDQQLFSLRETRRKQLAQNKKKTALKFR